ncbi:MAG: hypothetical protein AAGF11_06585 [Myxococcota bacterium]
MDDTIQERLRFRWNGREIDYAPSGWSMTPGTSVGIGIKMIAGEAGLLNVTHQRNSNGTLSRNGQPARKYRFQYLAGGGSHGVSVLDGGLQLMPGDWPSGGSRAIWRLRDAPKGREQELGPPTGLRGECLFMGSSAAVGFAAGGSLLLMGGQGLFDVHAWVDRLKRNPTQPVDLFHNFKYAAILWSVGVETNISAGGSVMYGSIWSKQYSAPRSTDDR